MNILGGMYNFGEKRSYFEMRRVMGIFVITQTDLLLTRHQKVKIGPNTYV